MNAHVAIRNGECQPEPRTALGRAIHWLQNYINENPYTDAAREARNIVRGLEAVRERPAVDELLALVGQIAKSDQGLQEINRAKIRMSQPEREAGKET
jgi:hypothetical protein